MSRVVLTMSPAALSERGWPSIFEDPDAAAARAARSVASVAGEHRVVVTHCLPEGIVGRLQRGLERTLGRPVMSIASPDVAAIERFSESGFVVLCAMGTVESCNEDAASDLASQLAADVLVLLIDEPVVWEQPPEGDPHPVRTASPASLGSLHFDQASATVLTAASRFVETTGCAAAIGAIDHLEAMLTGEGGTVIRDDDTPATYYGPQVRSA